MNDTNTDGDGPTRIHTATGRDKLRTAGGTPTARLNTSSRATAVERKRDKGGSK